MTTPSAAARLRSPTRMRLYGFDAEQRTVVFSGQQIQEAVGTLMNVPDALFQVIEHRLASEFFPFLVEHDALDLSGARYPPLPETDPAKRERSLILEKEFALFGEKQAEPREVDLLFVRLDLRKVGVVT